MSVPSTGLVGVRSPTPAASPNRGDRFDETSAKSTSGLDPIRLVAVHSKACGLARLVALGLATLMNSGTRQTRPTSYDEIAAWAGVSRKSVSRSVLILKELGEWSMDVGRGRRARSVFRLELRAFAATDGIGDGDGRDGSALQANGRTADSQTEFLAKLSQPDHKSKNADNLCTEFSTGTCTLSAGFERFWSEYPRKMKRAEAHSVWMRQISPDIVESVIGAVIAQRQTPDWRRHGGQFIPHPTTWLRGKRWQDEVPRAPGRAIAPALTVPDYAHRRAANLQRAIARLLDHTGPLAAECRRAADALQRPVPEIAAIDRALMESARGVVDMSEIRQAALVRLASHRARMTANQYERALTNAVSHAVRQQLRLPDLGRLADEYGPVSDSAPATGTLGENCV